MPREVACRSAGQAHRTGDWRRSLILASKRCKPFKTVVNDAPRAGLDAVERPARQGRYKTKPSPMRFRPGRQFDNVQELLAQIEGEDFR